MDDLQGTNLSSSLSTNFSSMAENGTRLTSKIYVFSPVSTSTKLTLFVLTLSLGVLGFVGNVLILFFLKSKKQATSFLSSCTFQKNFNIYIKSLAISDALCCVTGNPTSCVEFYFDIFQQDWPCKAIRYVNIFFPSVTLNNLLVISIEKYFSTRKVPRTFKSSTVKKLVCFAWIAPIFYVLIPAATYKGVRYEIDETRYTLSCKYDKHYLPFRIMLVTYLGFQYLIPSIIILIISICLISTLRSRMNRTIDIQRDNAIRATMRDAKRRGTVISITLMLAFVIPYLLYFVQVIYNMATKADISYETDFIIRYGGAALAFSNSVINVVIYFVQMKDFRNFLKEKFVKRFAPGNAVVEQTEELQMQ